MKRILFLLLATTHLFAAFPSDTELTERLRAYVDAGRMKGVVAGILLPDGSMRIVAAGDAKADTVFQIASNTKVFTTTLLADMVARHEVSLSDPVAKYLPKEVRVPSRNGRVITLLDLATHTAGFPKNPDNLHPADPANTYGDYTVEQLYAFLNKYELPRDPGADFEYSNLGVGLLGHALSRAAGRSYEELVRTRILEPLGMKSSGITQLLATPALQAAGALHANAADLLKFLAANLAHPSLAHQKQRELQKGAIGLGWLLFDENGHKVVAHGGGIPGYRSFMAFDPAARTAVVILAHSDNGVEPIGMNLIAPPAERTEVKVADEVLARYVGTYELSPTLSFVVTHEDGSLFA